MIEKKVVWVVVANDDGTSWVVAVLADEEAAKAGTEQLNTAAKDARGHRRARAPCHGYDTEGPVVLYDLAEIEREAARLVGSDR